MYSAKKFVPMIVTERLLMCDFIGHILVKQKPQLILKFLKI